LLFIYLFGGSSSVMLSKDKKMLNPLPIVFFSLFINSWSIKEVFHPFILRNASTYILLYRLYYYQPKHVVTEGIKIRIYYFNLMRPADADPNS